MRFKATALAICFLLGCGHASAARTSLSPQAALPSPQVEFLLASAAADFHAHGPPPPLHFRNVRSGYVTTPAGERRYRLCGSLWTASMNAKGEWLSFVTIRTSGYEQLLGAQSENFCKDSSATWDKGDLSSSLQTRLDSLQVRGDSATRG